MPIITVGDLTIEADPNKRLVLAIEDAGIPVLHRCGGYAKCTTCRVSFIANEPTKMTEAEKRRLQSEDGLYGRIRLSCQILCEQDMTVRPVMTMENSVVDSPGKRPEDIITPEAVWTVKD
jgi:ferredoxin